MIFSMLAAVAALPGLALRPQHSNSASFARLAEGLSAGVTDEMTFLKEASSVVNDVLLQAGNATEHLTKEDTGLLESVKDVIQQMYGRMQDQKKDQEGDLERLWQAILSCNADIDARQSSTGDLGMLHKQAVDLQIELNRLQGVVDDKTHDNDTAWAAFDLHMQTIGDAPDCPAFPNPRGMAQLDVYFEKSLYSAWWSASRSLYYPPRDEYLEADAALRRAIVAYNIHKAKLDVKYCDYKVELEAACASYEQCYATQVRLYNVKVADVKITVAKNLKIVKAAQTLLAQVRFLLAQQKTRDTPPYSTDEWMVAYKAVPKKTLCDLSTLTSSNWNPPITCLEVTDFVEGIPVKVGEGIRASCSGYDPTQAHGGTVHVQFVAADGEIILTFAPRWGRRNTANGMNQDHIVRNTRPSGKNWGKEEKGGGWPLGAIGSPFVIDFMRTESEWEVSINGDSAPEFNYRHRSSKPVAKVLLSTDKDGGVDDARVQLLRLVSGATTELASIQPAWDNHFAGFGAGVSSTKDTVERMAALDKIMLDYDEASIVSIWDAAKSDAENCKDGDVKNCKPKVEHRGLHAIKSMFDGLFDGLQGCTDAGVTGGLGAKLEVVEPTVSTPGSVFLVWECPHAGFHKATDTFVFEGVMIRKQNIVIETKSSAASSASLLQQFGVSEPIHGVLPAEYHPNTVQEAWDNHFAAFGKGAFANVGDDHTEALDMIMKDYTEASVVHIAAYAEGASAIPTFDAHQGLKAIRAMFLGLFDTIDDTCNLGAPLVEVTGDGGAHTAKQVFLVWRIPASKYKWATDTFVFDEDLKIVKQNIVVVQAAKDRTGC